MEEITLTISIEDIETLISILDCVDVEDLFEDNTSEEVIDQVFNDTVRIQKYLTRKLG